MDNFNLFIQRHFKISLIFFGLGLSFGIIYSLNLLGYVVNSKTLLPSSMRSIHISLMLYGFIPLMLSYLPFLLINKEVGYSKKRNALFKYIYYFLVYIFDIYGNFSTFWQKQGVGIL